MDYMNSEHEKRYLLYLKKDNTSQKDCERKSLFYILAISSDLEKHIEEIYDFENRWIKLECLEKSWQTSGYSAIIRLAYNLYNGYTDDNSDVLTIFSRVSADVRDYLYNAIRFRLSF